MFVTRVVLATLLSAALGACSSGCGTQCPEPTAQRRAIPEKKAVKAESVVAKVQSLVARGKLLYRLTAPDEVVAWLGPPDQREVGPSGGMSILRLAYLADGPTHVVFGRMREHPGPFTLRAIVTAGEKELDIGQDRLIVMRNEGDLGTADPFWGLEFTSLAKLDLRKQGRLLWAMSFDTYTQWPASEKLPPGFDPATLLEKGENPGLGLRELHARGIDGRGVRIAIIDQPLVADHVEYATQLARYEKWPGLEKMDPQMHGPAVASLAVGKTCGVAPKAQLDFYAVPTWKDDNQPYIDVVRRILDANQRVPKARRVRVVSISTAMFKHQAQYAQWQKVLTRAAREGLFVITCAQHQPSLSYALAARRPKADPDDPESYFTKQKWPPKDLLVPTHNRTRAGYRGPRHYVYDVEGGMSWSTPYLAGLAALAYQLDPNIDSATIIELWNQTTYPNEYGRLINPSGFIKAVRKRLQ